MSAETPDARALSARLDMILERLHNLEVQVRGMVESQSIEAREFVVKDDRGRVCARLEMREYSPYLTFYDGVGDERLRIGLRTDGSPSIQGGEREMLPEV